MRTMKRLFACMMFLAGACAIAAAQGFPNPVESAKRFIVEKMESDWQSGVTATWGYARTMTSGDEVTVFGYGLAHRESTNLDAVFTFEVKIYTIRTLAPVVAYSILRWSNTPVDDKYLFTAAKEVVKQRLQAELRSGVRLDFADPKFSNLSAEVRQVEGAGTFAATRLSGNFTYSIRFSRITGAIVSVVMSGAPSNPGAGWGGYNAFTESVAQSHASEYVRAREGFQVQVQFTGPVTHTLVSKGIDRVVGRGQWRRGNNFTWNDFQYDIQVGFDDGKIITANVSLTPEVHGSAEDQKFIGFAQSAVRRDFRAQSPAQITFLSATVKALSFGKKSVNGEFSAGGARYRYEVVMDGATTRTDSVKITRG